jgi:NADPH-dependent glutamate synthase beta subunit-like oxidoreductase
VLGRTCDRPCEPACRRGRVEKEPVAICRLKRVAADFKDDIRDRLPKPAVTKNGKRIALVGGGPARATGSWHASGSSPAPHCATIWECHERYRHQWANLQCFCGSD